MTVDFAALAGTVREIPGVQACLFLSRDGLALAADPPSEEDRVMAAWTRLAGLGDVEKGFLTMNGGAWMFSRRGPFAAMALADMSARPGVVLAQLDQALLAAEEDRARSREEIRSTAARPIADATQAPRFRAPMHREPRQEPRPKPVHATPEPTESETAAPLRRQMTGDSDWEVDMVELAREFGGLYSQGDSAEDAQ